jgi:hypothetical protein
MKNMPEVGSKWHTRFAEINSVDCVVVNRNGGLFGGEDEAVVLCPVNDAKCSIAVSTVAWEAYLANGTVTPVL